MERLALDLVFDVGANVGDTVAAFLEKGAARVIAIEPTPHLIDGLMHRFKRDNRVTVLPAALSDHIGEIDFYVSNASTLSSASKSWTVSSRFAATNEWQHNISVPSITLDSLVKEFGEPTFIKIDVEGYEDHVIKGLSSPIGATISFEWTEENLTVLTTCLAHLATLGYSRFGFTRGSDSFDTFPEITYSYDELLAVLVPSLDQTRKKSWGMMYAQPSLPRTVAKPPSPVTIPPVSSAKTAPMIALCGGGLANRILCLAASYSLAQSLGRPMHIVWPTGRQCRAPLYDIFDTDLEAISLADLSCFDRVHKIGDPQTKPPTSIQKPGFLEQLQSIDRGTVVALPDHPLDWPEMDACLEKLFGKLRIKPQYESAANDFVRDQNFVAGVHLRGTDKVLPTMTDVDERAVNLVQNCLAQLAHSNERLFVCSDERRLEELARSVSSQVVARSKQEYVRKADINYPWFLGKDAAQLFQNFNVDRSHRQVLDGLVDLLVLSKLPFIDGLFTGSTFLQLARALHRISERKARVSRPPELEYSEPPRTIPAALLPRYTMRSRIAVSEWYFDQRQTPGSTRVFAKTQLEMFTDKIRNRESHYYGKTDQDLYACFDEEPIRGKRCLVVGSQTPWYEGVCFHYGAASVTTADYQCLVSYIPNHIVKTIEDLDENPGRFDALVSISSIEHSGLGRYGDPLDPDGDLAAMDWMRRQLGPGGRLYLAVPLGIDRLVWNAHRIYGRLRLPRLLQGWRMTSSYGYDPSMLDRDGGLGGGYQPILVLAPI